MNISEEIIRIYDELSASLEGYQPPGMVAYTYNPLTYAKRGHNSYLYKYASSERKILFLGMNPGPWGMAQCGVPFGAIPNVINWLKINEEIDTPIKVHPKKPVEGFHCQRVEVSGSRLWGLFEEKFTDPKHFFYEHLVLNYCPLIFFDEGGKNLAPDKFSKEFALPLEEKCDKALSSILMLLKPQNLIGVGNYARDNLDRVWKNNQGWLKGELGQDYQPFIGKILHPSPASPAANRGWARQAEKQLLEQKIWS